MITNAIFGFFSSAFLCLLIIRYQHLHVKYTADSSHGPQKFHKNATPRVGGVPIFLTMLLIWLIQVFASKEGFSELSFLIAAFPVFIAGLIEDITKQVGVKLRLLAAFISGVLAYVMCDVKVMGFDIPWIDPMFAYAWICIPVTAFAIAGVANAYNIIDGFNGLASMVAVICLGAIAAVAFRVEDTLIIHLCILMIAPLLGFFIWNYPRGLIFLGDAGAYLIGFWTAVISILIVVRNPNVSPWFALMVNAYPITETLFTIWRRSIHQGKNPGLPDAAHFHSLIYRRVIRWATPNNEKVHIRASRNARTSPYLWVLSSLGVFPAIVFWDSTEYLMISAIMYAIFYIWSYWKIVTFKISPLIKR
jgi:UDP-N-acetylmuramyl pentapeptide phosphotransferase/UDP-N-acetylglucosamine-1-phosphate transferase